MKQLDKIPRLVDAFGVFKFDLNFGQTCEFVYPADSLSSDDLKAISMLAFPDSQSGTQRDAFDCVYTFSHRLRGPRNHPSGDYGSSLRESGQFIQCYVYFRQTEDASSARGYYQKSFVLISSSSRSFTNCDDLIALVRRVGNKFYLAEESGCGREVLMDAFSHVEENGFMRMRSSSSDMGTSLTSLSIRSLELSGSPISPSTAAFALESIYLMIEGLWHLWEALLVGLPVLVYCPGRADMCSRLVLSMTSLISPVEYVGDLRPFLSIFDPDYAVFRTSNSLGACVVGVTSPMAFQQLINSFSVILVFNQTEEEMDSSKFVQVAKSDRGRMYVSESITSVSSGTRTRVSSLAARLSMLSGSTQTGYRLVLPSDLDTVCNRFVSSSDGINRAIITRHLSLLTRDFLMAFVEYVETDSSVLNADLFGPTPVVELFVPGQFLASLSVGVGRHLSSVSAEKLRTLYSGFIKTGSFRKWLAEQQSLANRESITAHKELIASRLSEDKIIWMSVSEKERGVARIDQLTNQIGIGLPGPRGKQLMERLDHVRMLLSGSIVSTCNSS